MSGKGSKQLLDRMGDIDERYILEYMNAHAKAHKAAQMAGRGLICTEEHISIRAEAHWPRQAEERRSMRAEGRRPVRMKTRLMIVLAAVMIMLLGTVSLAAAIPAIGHFLENLRSEQRAFLHNFNEIQAEYAVPIDDTQECDGVVGTLNSAVLEDQHLLLSYTFDWSGLEEAKDGSFHTWFLPWFFYIAEGDRVICQSEYTNDLHTQTYGEEADGNPAQETFVYCIDLKDMGGEDLDGSDLVGKELTVQLLYSQGGEGFCSSFTPETCFPDNSWNIDKSYEFDGRRIHLDRVQESALYVTLFIDCDTIGHSGDEYAFVLSDELGNDYTAYSNDTSPANAYWFTKPQTMGTQLTLKVIRSGLQSDSHGVITDDSYEVLYEIPIERKTSTNSFWNDFF